MSHLKTLSLLMMFCLPILASVELNTSINDVYYRGDHELLGSITMTFKSDELPDVSPDQPAFFRISLDKNSVLANTLVNQNSKDPILSQPIYLAMSLNTGPGFSINAPADSVSVVRWVAGETSFWIQIQRSSSTWVMQDGGVAMPPSQNVSVSFVVGVSAQQSDNNNEFPMLANLPFNSRDLTAIEREEANPHLFFCVPTSAIPQLKVTEPRHHCRHMM